jgi:hypothetical protein
MDDGTYWRCERPMDVPMDQSEITLEQITEDQFLDAMNEYDPDLMDWT